MLPTFQYHGCGIFSSIWLPGLTWSISSSWALAPGHSTATFTMSEGGGIAPDAFTTAYNPHLLRERIVSSSENYLNSYIALYQRSRPHTKTSHSEIEYPTL